MGCKLFVGNLPADATGAELQKVFAAYGVVKWADVAMDQATAKCRGFGFVQMGSEQEAGRAASELSGRAYHGQRMVVSESKKRPATSRAPKAVVGKLPQRTRPPLVAGRSHHRSPRRG